MLANRLKQCRTARRLTIKELAVRSGVSTETIKRVESTKVLSHIHWETMHKLCAALDLKPNQVFPDAKAQKK